MNKKTEKKAEKIIQRYLRNMQLEMQRYANEISKLAFEEGDEITK